MAVLKKLLRALFERVEFAFDFAFGQRLNPFSWLGAFGWYYFWIVAGTGTPPMHWSSSLRCTCCASSPSTD